ncbi:solute carrier organic anion transporter family member 74D-like [Epargyreus clarus]|uniref:solute carrier organic anion transporter family member 74D-like n=1 Tax=Epargyreus clarus TaxID=520877 RepID=UPI003C2BB925
MLQNGARSGDLPEYLPDVTITVMAMIEALVSPFVSWFGYQRRRTMVVFLVPLLVLILISWLLLPEARPKEESEFCDGRDNSVHFGILEESSAIRLGVVIFSCLLFMLARIAIWCHGFAYIEEHGPDRVSLHFGVIVMVRVIVLAIGYHMVQLKVRHGQIIGFIVGFVIQFLQIMYFMPTSTLKHQDRQKVPTEDRHFSVSIRRVLSNRLALSQILSLGFLTAGLWGYGYHYSDIVKVKFLTYQNSTAMLFFTEIFQYLGILMSVLYIGLRWSSPIQQQFCKLRALKQSLMMSIFAGVIVLVMALAVSCEHGRVAGLTGVQYINPGCSAVCGCTARWREFSPVCVVDDMTTYLSPCQAGCGGAEDEGGLRVYKNCTCAISGRAVSGACGAAGCGAARALHRMLYVLLLTFGVLAIQAHGVLLLKTVDPRDKSVVLGLAGSSVALFAFVGGHIAFNGINEGTCVWSESGRCHLNSRHLPLLVSEISATMIFTSTVLCLINFIYTKTKRSKIEVTRL